MTNRDFPCIGKSVSEAELKRAEPAKRKDRVARRICSDLRQKPAHHFDLLFVNRCNDRKATLPEHLPSRLSFYSVPNNRLTPV